MADLRGQRARPSCPARGSTRCATRASGASSRYAARHVPYYRDLFAREGIDPRDVRGAADLDRCLLDTDAVRAEPDRFLSARVAPGDRSPLLERLHRHAARGPPRPALAAREHRLWRARARAGDRALRRVVPAQGAPHRLRDVELPEGQASTRTPRGCRSSRGARRWSMIAAVRRDRRRRQQRAARRAHRVRRLHRPVLPDRRSPAASICTRRRWSCTWARRSRPSAAHGSRRTRRAVLSRYCAVEAFKIGYFCERAPASTCTRTCATCGSSADDGSDAPAGEPGRIVISNLVNHATVLLNYPMGDVASLPADPCSCGRTTGCCPRSKGASRTSCRWPAAQTPSARRVGGVKDDDRVLQYQLVQHEPRRFELRSRPSTSRRSRRRAIARSGCGAARRGRGDRGSWVADLGRTSASAAGSSARSIPGAAAGMAAASQSDDGERRPRPVCAQTAGVRRDQTAKILRPPVRRHKSAKDSCSWRR